MIKSCSRIIARTKPKWRNEKSSEQLTASTAHDFACDCVLQGADEPYFQETAARRAEATATDENSVPNENAPARTTDREEREVSSAVATTCAGMRRLVSAGLKTLILLHASIRNCVC